MYTAGELEVQIAKLHKDIDQVLVPEPEKEAARNLIKEAQSFYSPDNFPIFLIEESFGHLRLSIWGYSKTLTFTPYSTSCFQAMFKGYPTFTTPQEIIQFIEDKT